MIYVENDFYSNFNGAVKSDDDVTIHNMLVDQLSTLIAKRRGEVIQLFQKVGVKLSQNPSNEEISQVLTANVSKNKKLQVGLAYLIAKQNDILSGSEKKSNVRGNRKIEEEASNACEKVYEEYLKRNNGEFTESGAKAFNDCKSAYIKKNSKRKIDWGKSADTVSSIATTLGLLASTFGGGKGNKFRNDLRNQSNVKSPNYSSGQQFNQNNDETKKKYTWLWITLGVVAVGGIGFLAYKKGVFNKKIAE